MLSLSLLCALIINIVTPSASGATERDVLGALGAESAILIDADDKLVMLEKNARERMGEASTTKIMTALVICRTLPLDKIVSVPPEAVGTEGSSVYLREGELLSVRDLLYALLLASANDAAVALALSCAPSIDAFAEKMNLLAAELGLRDTNFTNPHGLYDENHYTTAYDLALIGAEALKNEDLRAIFATKKATIPLGVTPDLPEGEGQRYLQNHNKMLSLYDGAIGVKTGFTKKTGRCLVSAAERDGMTLICVTLNCPDDWRDHTKMLDYGFSGYERATLFDVGEYSYSYAVSGGTEGYVCAVNSEAIALTLPKKREKTVACAEFPQRFEIAPIDSGELLGRLCVSVGDRCACSPLVAAYSVKSSTEEKHKFFRQG